MKKSLLSFFLVLVSLSLSARQSFWNDTPESSLASQGKRTWMPDSYRTVRMDLNMLKLELDAVPLEAQANLRQSQSTLSLPAPDGKEMTFTIMESPVMAPELASAYPMIRTYLGVSTTDSRVSARFDLTPFGFHAMVFSAEGVYYVEPYTFGNTSEYITYYKKDITAIMPSMICENDDEAMDQVTGGHAVVTPRDYSAQRSIGSQLRTYRLALACTGEYAQFFGGTVTGALAAMVTSINRCNGVYERELGLRLVMVPNDTLLIYLNPANDPYSNNSGGTMLGENQSNVNTVIGNSNYDIGHVFSTGGGGVAYKGCVCSNSNKARGVTGSNAPLGDPFDIDYVAHEMGHQFGADHTFNATSGSCSGNRVSSAAFEPGSASTIMGYAGICGNTNDLQSNSDAYYQSYSFDQIVTYMHNGTGNTCAAQTVTSNQAPVVAHPGNYTIPYQTPFRLSASAYDPDGDPLTYCWEQMDKGSSGNWNNPKDNAPIFRSFAPQASSTRFFPKYSSVLNNTSVKGELKPSYARTLHFRCTARDQRTGGGGVSYNDTLVNVDVINTGTGFAVTYPNASGITWMENSTQTITWDVAQSDIAPINTPTVNILLSTDNGQTFPVVLGNNVPNTGSYTFTVPSNLTSTARIWIEGAGNIFYDVNNNPFTITINTAAVNLDVESLITVYPNPGKGVFEVTLPPLTNKELKLDVYNQLGMQVYTSSIKTNSSKTSVDLSNLSNGVYQFLFTLDGARANKKIVLLR